MPFVRKGPYVNVETNAGWVGDDYTTAVTDLHVGYEGPIGESAWRRMFRALRRTVNVDGEEAATEISGKAGVGVDVTESLNIYGEVSFLTEDQSFTDDLGVGAKVGVKWTF